MTKQTPTGWFLSFIMTTASLGSSNRHYHTMVQDLYMTQVFPAPPVICYRRQQNIRDHLIRAKVPHPTPARPQRTYAGMKKCCKCVNYHYIKIPVQIWMSYPYLNNNIQISRPFLVHTNFDSHHIMSFEPKQGKFSGASQLAEETEPKLDFIN